MFNQGRISEDQNRVEGGYGVIPVQCFPIYSILKALNRTTVDYFSLDIEGDELSVLKTIPWKSIDIKVSCDNLKRERESMPRRVTGTVAGFRRCPSSFFMTKRASQTF